MLTPDVIMIAREGYDVCEDSDWPSRYGLTTVGLF